MNTFTNPNDPANVHIIAALKKWIIEERLQNKETAVDTENIEIIEIKCAEPGCLHFETSIRVKAEDQIQYFKIAKPLVFIRKWDVANLKPTNSSSTFHSHSK